MSWYKREKEGAVISFYNFTIWTRLDVCLDMDVCLDADKVVVICYHTINLLFVALNENTFKDDKYGAVFYSMFISLQ